jgi:aminomethyltransferase
MPDDPVPVPAAASSPLQVADASVSRRGPLHDRHLALGAKMADFGGWQMPIDYLGGGVLKEHAAVRGAVGIFDVSHLGKATVSGPGAQDFVNLCLTNDLGRITTGRAQYTLCCDDATGGVVDDLIVYLSADDELLLIPNAANSAEVQRRLRAAAPAGIEVRDRHTEYAVLAVQGPRSFDLMAAVGLPTDLEYMAFRWLTWRGTPLAVCRTGYTGERGFELLPRWESAGQLWQALLAAAPAYGGRPCGLGARDTLRTEMGYPLHGQDLRRDITPVQAQLGWAVGWRKPQFWGRAALAGERERGANRLLRGLESLDRGIPRAGMPVLSASGEPVGTVTSGTFSPTKRSGIALALLDRSVGGGDEVRVDVRGRPSRMRVVKLPFVPASTG